MRPETAAAFSLVEVLVAVAVVAALLGLAFFGMSRIRDRGVETRDLSSMRSHAQVLFAYAADHSGSLPYFTRPGYQSTSIYVDDELMAAGVSYFDAHQTWHMALADDYYNSAAPWSEQFHPAGYFDAGEPLHWPRHTAFAYACVFIAAPSYWNPRSRLRPDLGDPDDPPQLRAVRIDEVSFPGDKSLLVQTWSATDRDPRAGSTGPPVQTAMVDGSGASLTPEERHAGYRSGDGFNEFYQFGTIHFSDDPPLLHTIDGARGRDRR